MKKTTLTVLGLIVLVVGIGYLAANIKHQVASLGAEIAMMHDSFAASATPIESESTSTGRMAAEIRILSYGGTCYVQQWSIDPDGEGSWHTISYASMSGPNICSAIGILGYVKQSSTTADTSILAGATFVTQTQTTCAYYAPTIDGWTKYRTILLTDKKNGCMAPSKLAESNIKPIDVKLAESTYASLKESGVKNISLSDILAPQKSSLMQTARAPWVYVTCFDGYGEIGWSEMGSGWIDPNGWQTDGHGYYDGDSVICFDWGETGPL